MRRTLVRAAGTGAILACLSFGASAADLVWEVESPFRFFKTTSAFALHETAYKQVRGAADTPAPADAIWRLERRLNDPDCRDPSTPERCAATKRARYEQSRLGWAAQTLSSVCYESNTIPRRYPTQCERRYSWGTAREDYVLPEAHTVAIGLSPLLVAEAGAGVCQWNWKPRAATGRAESKTLPCKATLTIPRVPFSTDRAASGVSVTVKLPDGRELVEPNVVVDDVLVVAVGDSFASGESNPDRPVTFSGVREMVYDPALLREEHAARKKPSQNFAVANADGRIDHKVLPRRRLEDEDKAQMYRPASREFLAAFEQRGARWLSADCHRSQYGYPFRVGLQMTLENRHRAVTLISLACSGAEINEGLFRDMAAREGKAARVAAQFDQLSDLLCRGGSKARTQHASYALPVYRHGSPGVSMQSIEQRWCPPSARKRTPDLVLMSVGGNDVGFGALALYAMTESASDVAPIVGLVGGEVRFSAQLARLYLDHLDERMKAVKAALKDGFGVEPARVVQNAYEPIHLDETGALCGTQPTLGLDVHPNLKLSKVRLQETAEFFRDFVARLECISGRGRNCPAGLATGSGTGFTLVTEHQAKFARRGICARNPRTALVDGLNMAMPRKSASTGEFKPYAPSEALPYATRWRLFRTPNDAFLAANTHREGISPFDILQPAYAGLFSGAVHPTAEAHAIVADHVMTHARRMLDRSPDIQVRTVTTGQR